MMGGASAGMSIHKAEGLFPADGECASNIPGLYAAGDSLGSMQTGGIYTQVGSSLAGSAVQGAMAGKAAARFAGSTTLAPVSESTLEELNTEIYAPLLRERGFSPRMGHPDPAGHHDSQLHPLCEEQRTAAWRR